MFWPGFRARSSTVQSEILLRLPKKGQGRVGGPLLEARAQMRNFYKLHECGYCLYGWVAAGALPQQKVRGRFWGAEVRPAATLRELRGVTWDRSSSILSWTTIATLTSPRDRKIYAPIVYDDAANNHQLPTHHVHQHACFGQALERDQAQFNQKYCCASHPNTCPWPWAVI